MGHNCSAPLYFVGVSMANTPKRITSWGSHHNIAPSCSTDTPQSLCCRKYLIKNPWWRYPQFIDLYCFQNTSLWAIKPYQTHVCRWSTVEMGVFSTRVVLRNCSNLLRETDSSHADFGDLICSNKPMTSMLKSYPFLPDLPMEDTYSNIGV